jgi:hypothetical protein
MYVNITVKRIENYGFIRPNIHQEWTFTFIDETLYLNIYRCDEVMPPKRKGRNLIRYNRLADRDSNVTLENVPLPEDVKEEALKTFMSKISVKKWDIE